LVYRKEGFELFFKKRKYKKSFVSRRNVAVARRKKNLTNKEQEKRSVRLNAFALAP